MQRPWIALHEKGIDYQYKEVNPYKKDKDYLQVNPKGLVPALVHHGRNLNESTVILEYLEDISGPEVSLYPRDPFDRAVARLWIDHISKKIVPVFFRVLQAQASIIILPSMSKANHCTTAWKKANIHASAHNSHFTKSLHPYCCR